MFKKVEGSTFFSSLNQEKRDIRVNTAVMWIRICMEDTDPDPGGNKENVQKVPKI